MLISRKHGFIFIHIHKNAGTSITRALLPHVAGCVRQRFFRVTRKVMVSPGFDHQPCGVHATAPEVMERIGEPTFRTLFSFAIVRNPWDWEVSHYRYIMKTPKHEDFDIVNACGSFDAYLRWRVAEKCIAQSDFLDSRHGEQLVNYIGRFENLEADFGAICERIGIEASLPRLNATPGKPYQDYYTPRSREMLAQAYAKDIERFGYAFEA